MPIILVRTPVAKGCNVIVTQTRVHLKCAPCISTCFAFFANGVHSKNIGTLCWFLGHVDLNKKWYLWPSGPIQYTLVFNLRWCWWGYFNMVECKSLYPLRRHTILIYCMEIVFQVDNSNIASSHHSFFSNRMSGRLSFLIYCVSVFSFYTGYL